MLTLPLWETSKFNPPSPSLHSFLPCGSTVDVYARFVSEYYIEGHQFVRDNVIIFLHRVLHEPGVRSLETEPKTELPAFSALQPLDPSGTYIFEAKIRVQDLNNPTILDSGVGEMLKFKEHMKGCVELYVPDRLTMDTRVKWQPKNVMASAQQIHAR